MDEKDKCFHPECGCQKDELTASLVEQRVMEDRSENSIGGCMDMELGIVEKCLIIVAVLCLIRVLYYQSVIWQNGI